MNSCCAVGNDTPESMADPWTTVPELRLNLCVYILCMAGGLAGNICVILIMWRQVAHKVYEQNLTDRSPLTEDGAEAGCGQGEDQPVPPLPLRVRPAARHGRRPHPAAAVLLSPAGRKRRLLQTV